MHDSPGLKVGDDLLDDIADLIYLRAEFFLPVQEIAAGGLPDGGDHVISYVAFVAHPVARVKCEKCPGFTQAVRVMPAPVHRVGNPRDPPAECGPSKLTGMSLLLDNSE